MWKQFWGIWPTCKHSVEIHGGAPGVTCNFCGKSFVDDDKLKNHKSEQHEHKSDREKSKKSKDFKCSKCNKIIRTSIGVERHTELFCEECKKCLPERPSFDIHMGVHHNQSNKTDIYVCERCEKSYEGEEKYSAHYCNPQPPQTIHCDQCPFTAKCVRDIANQT